MRRALLASATALLALVSPLLALADPILARDGRFEAAVSSREMTRISIQGDKIETVRKIDDPSGAKMMVEIDPTGDAFVVFDGDVAGRSFSAFLITASGRTVQAVLSPHDGPGQTILVALPNDLPRASVAQPPVEDASASTTAPTPVSASEGPRREGYTETLTALIRLMFNGAAPAGIEKRFVADKPHRAGAFDLQTLETYSVEGLRGSVISLRNVTRAAQPLSSKTFLVHGVLAAAVSHESVQPGQNARVYLVEEGGQ